jgi:hypothetical protein
MRFVSDTHSHRNGLVSLDSVDQKSYEIFTLQGALKIPAAFSKPRITLSDFLIISH